MIFRLAVDESIAHGARRRRNIYDRYRSLHFVMTRLVEEVAEADDAHRLAREVQGQTGAGTAEGADQGIQFLASILQVGAGDGEISAVARGGCDEEELVLLVPKLVGDFGSGLKGDPHGNNGGCRRHRRLGKWPLRPQSSGECRRCK